MQYINNRVLSVCLIALFHLLDSLRFVCRQNSVRHCMWYPSVAGCCRNGVSGAPLKCMVNAFYTFLSDMFSYTHTHTHTHLYIVHTRIQLPITCQMELWWYSYLTYQLCKLANNFFALEQGMLFCMSQLNLWLLLRRCHFILYESSNSQQSDNFKVIH